MVLRSVTVCAGGGLFRVKRAVVVEGDNSGDFRGWCGGYGLSGTVVQTSGGNGLCGVVVQ